MAERTAFAGFVSFKLESVKVKYDRELGRGSYATVLEVDYMGLKCAGKKIHEVLMIQGGYSVSRFEEECRLLSELRHPNIVQFLGVFFENGAQIPVLVMEFLPTNLTSCMERYGVFPDEINYSVLHDVALGLLYLHNQTPSIVHRDLSANNVLLTPNMTAKISDLGVARIINLSPLQVSRMTQTPGTPAYMPPEVMVANPKYDTSIDVFSYGVMMIHTFSGRWPEPHIGPSKVVSGKLIPVTEAERREKFLTMCGSDHPLLSLILKCIHNDPQQRPYLKEIVEKQAEMVSQFPASFTNRLEMLQHIQVMDIAIARPKKNVSHVEEYFTSKKQQPSSIKWTSCTSIPITMNSGHAIAIDGKVYYGGGLTDHTKVKDDILEDNIVHCYDKLQDNWTQLPPLKVKCFGLGQINNELVAIGGVSKTFQDRQIRPEVYTFDKMLQRWREKIPPMITARCFHGVISLQSALVVAGGQVSSPAESCSYTDSVEIFKHSDQKWYQTNPLPICLFNMSTAYHLDTCYVVGGFRNKPLNRAFFADVKDLLSNAVLSKEIANNKAGDQSVWMSLPNTPTAQPASTILAGRLFAIGGSLGNPIRQAQKSIWGYSPGSSSWEHIYDLPARRRLVTAVSLSPLEVLVIGGRVQDSDVNTVGIGSIQH